MAELAAIGKAQLWPIEPTPSDELRHDLQWMDTHRDILQLWLGRLEGLLSRHWPE